MDPKTSPEHPGTSHSPRAHSPGSPRNPIVIDAITTDTAQPSTASRPQPGSSSSASLPQPGSSSSASLAQLGSSSLAPNSTPTTNPPTTTARSLTTYSNTTILLRDLFQSNITRVLLIDPSPTCTFCPPVLAHYQSRRQLVETLERQLSSLQCTDICKTTRDKLILTEQKTSQHWIFQHMQAHLKAHPQCGITKDIPRYS